MLPHTFENISKTNWPKCKYCGASYWAIPGTPSTDCLPEVEVVQFYRYAQLEHYVVRMPAFGTLADQEYTCVCAQCEGRGGWTRHIFFDFEFDFKYNEISWAEGQKVEEKLAGHE